MNKLIALLLAGTILASAPTTAGSMLQRKIISKEEKDNIQEILWGAAALGVAGYGYFKCKTPMSQGTAAVIAALCAYKWLGKIQAGAQHNHYDSTLEFVQDKTLSRLYALWNKLNLQLAFHI